MEPLVTIAIPNVAGSDARDASLASLTHHTPEPHEIVLLVEESRCQDIFSQQGYQNVRQLAVPEPFSTPAALNRLLQTSSTPYLLLLEEGAIVTSGWLSYLLEPLHDSSVGLSGPSTNISWNEQQVMQSPGGLGWSIQQIDAYAAGIAARYHNHFYPLDTLHSLGDFCYLFRRSVAEQLGGFDEAYGAGPCWEIDFNTRAARAGFRAVWVAAAYVHRIPAPPSRAQTIRRLFTANKQLYQDRFCGLRLRGEKKSYEFHCRGEACEHFAPRDLIRVTLQPKYKDREPGPAPGVSSVLAAVGEKSKDHDPGLGRSQEVRFAIIQPGSDLPLISCIMPTCNRRAFVRQALAYFERQDYPNRELIVVDDGEDRVADLMPSNLQIRYIALPGRTSIGVKRNLACERACGTIIAHWDDDDWYAPHRLQHQAAPLLDKRADMTGLETPCFFDLTHWQAWTCTPELHRRLFIGDVHGGTLVYWRWVWERLARYPARSVAEDAVFLRQAVQRGARLHKLPHASSFVYVRHSSNAWNFPLGSYLYSAGWQRTEPGVFLPPGDLSFYKRLSPTTAIPGSGKDDPLVSCIMPTYNRRAFVKQAITYFLRQDYPNKELIIVDDGTDAIDDLVPVDEHFRYIRLSEKTTVGAKRNLACEQARGTIIAHWDDDDWHAPHRLRYQIEVLLRERTDLCGINTLLFYDPGSGHAWQYVYRGSGRVWLSGSSLCYKRSFWASNRFANINIGEDARFVWNGPSERITTLPDMTFHVGMIHPYNISPKRTGGSYWRPYPVEEIQRLLGSDWAFYQSGQVKFIGGID